MCYLADTVDLLKLRMVVIDFDNSRAVNHTDNHRCPIMEISLFFASIKAKELIPYKCITH